MQMTPRAARPRFLLVEDDIISRGFFKAALETLPADVDTADSLASALASAEPGSHDLWLIDVNLPDGNGAQLLRELRRSHPDTPALAHTADGDASIHARLREAGFSDTLVKPLGRDQLLKAVRRALVNSPAGIFVAQAPAAVELAVQDWDETAALAALNGQRNHLIALRELFLAELPGVRDAVEQAVDQHDERQLRSQLHRLQASCGFVGRHGWDGRCASCIMRPIPGRPRRGSATRWLPCCTEGCSAGLRPCNCRGFKPRQQQRPEPERLWPLLVGRAGVGGQDTP